VHCALATRLAYTANYIGGELGVDAGLTDDHCSVPRHIGVIIDGEFPREVCRIYAPFMTLPAFMGRLVPSGGRIAVRENAHQPWRDDALAVKAYDASIPGGLSVEGPGKAFITRKVCVLFDPMDIRAVRPLSGGAGITIAQKPAVMHAAPSALFYRF
jgi:hypothetical protein